MNADINIRKLTKQSTMTVNVHVTKEFQLRAFIATALIRIASWVLNCNVDIQKTTDANL